MNRKKISFVTGEVYERQDSVETPYSTSRELALPHVNIQPLARVGDTERKQTIHHIQEMETQGYISAEEATARIEHAANAEMGSHLRQLTSDLPAPIDHRNLWQKWDWNKPQYNAPVLAFTIFASLCTAIIPGIILDQMHELTTAAGESIFTVFLIAGIIGFFTSIITLIVKNS